MIVGLWNAVDVNPEELVDGYWQYYRLSTGDRAERLDAERSFWAWQAVDEVVGEGSADDLVEQLVRLADGAPSDGSGLDDDQLLQSALAYLGAGPIEDLLCCHADRFLAQVDSAAERNERFRYALRCAWFESCLDADDARRLRRFGRSP